jgi:hypothetical protein
MYNKTPAKYKGPISNMGGTHILFQKETNSSKERNKSGGNQSPTPVCSITVYNRSKAIFRSNLIAAEPDFIQFSLKICDKSSIKPSVTSNTFQRLRWFWTYNTSSGPFPFLSWNLDYGILSFHLLEAKTINIPYVCVAITPPDKHSKCEFTFGQRETSEAVTKALIPLIDIRGGDIIKFPESYFCYLTTRREKYCNTMHYWAAIYLSYPMKFIHYTCCLVEFNYTNNSYSRKCIDGDKDIAGVHSWIFTTKLPYFLGVLFLLYFPIMLYKMTAWLSKDEIIHEDITLLEMTDDFECQETLNENWLYADGCSPLTLGDLLSFKTIGLDRHPILVSRLRRLLFVFMFPIFIYIQIAMYTEGMGQWSTEKIFVRDLVKVGTPMGFLSLFGDAEDRRNVFVPILGGPLGVVALYYALSLIFMALPRSVKQVVETGLPTSNLLIKSPLFFATSEIIEMSRINVQLDQMKPGYIKASTLMKCRFYMLFTCGFWKELWNLQIERIRFLYTTESRCCLAILSIVTVPLYVALCFVEILLCIMYHGLPFCTFVSCMINGGLKSLRYLRSQSLLLNAIFKYYITCYIGVAIVFVSFMVYIYVIFLTFIISLGFIFNVITHCFVAIIIYPSVSFGYLFFFIVLFYYFINLIRNFGDGYMELLATTVDVSRHLSLDESRISVRDGHLEISNTHFENIVDIRINGVELQIPSNILHKIRTTKVVKIKERDCAFGVPKKLFEYIVTKHRPVHQQVIILCFKAVIMITFVILTFSISADYVSGPTSEISEVMHVIFIVAVGAFPQLVQAILSRSNTSLVNEVEERKIEKSIKDFWNHEATHIINQYGYGAI